MIIEHPTRDELLAALEGAMPLLARAESNASGNPEWDYVGPRVAAVRAVISKARAAPPAAGGEGK